MILEYIFYIYYREKWKQVSVSSSIFQRTKTSKESSIQKFLCTTEPRIWRRCQHALKRSLSSIKSFLEQPHLFPVYSSRYWAPSTNEKYKSFCKRIMRMTKLDVLARNGKYFLGQQTPLFEKSIFFRQKFFASFRQCIDTVSQSTFRTFGAI